MWQRLRWAQGANPPPARLGEGNRRRRWRGLALTPPPSNLRSMVPLPEQAQGGADFRSLLTLFRHHRARVDVTKPRAPAPAVASAFLATSGLEERGRACTAVQHRCVGIITKAGSGVVERRAAAVAGPGGRA